MITLDNPKSYNFSFMAVALRPELARIVAEIYLAEGNWDLTRHRILTSNALQCRSPKSAVRMERELRLRVGALTQEQIRLLATATAEDRAAIAWLAVIKHINFAFDFVAEVLREKIAIHDPILRYSDYEAFIEGKSASHPELVSLSTSSKNKVRQIVLNMLSEAGLIRVVKKSVTIQRPLLSPNVLNSILLDDPCWLEGFLVTDDEIRILR